MEPVTVGGTGTGPVAEFIIRGLDHCLHFTEFVVMNKLFQSTAIEFYLCHYKRFFLK
jgi:hypothetical protein